MTGKTYGKLIRGDVAGQSRFGVRAVPHVAQKLKRMFPRSDQTRPGIVEFTDTTEVARDLEWFMQRWPLEVDADTLAYLTARADEHRATEEAVTAILNGYLPPNSFREPALKPPGLPARRGRGRRSDRPAAEHGRAGPGQDVLRAAAAARP